MNKLNKLKNKQREVFIFSIGGRGKSLKLKMFLKYKKNSSIKCYDRQVRAWKDLFSKWKHSPQCYGCVHCSPVLTCFWVCFQIQSLKGKTFCGSAKKNFLKSTIMSVKNKHASLRITISYTATGRPGPIPYITLTWNRSLTFTPLLMLLLLRITAASFPSAWWISSSLFELPQKAVLNFPRQTPLFFSKILDLTQHDSHWITTPKEQNCYLFI